MTALSKPARSRHRALSLILLIIAAIATCAALYPLFEDWAATLVLFGILFVTAISIFHPRHP